MVDDDADNDRMSDDQSNTTVDAPAFQSKSNSVIMPVDEPKAKEAQDGWKVVSSRQNRGKRN